MIPIFSTEFNPLMHEFFLRTKNISLSKKVVIRYEYNVKNTITDMTGLVSCVIEVSLVVHC